MCFLKQTCFVIPQAEHGEGFGFLNLGHGHQQAEWLPVQVSLAPGPGEPVHEHRQPSSFRPAGQCWFKKKAPASQQTAGSYLSLLFQCRWPWSVQISVTPADHGSWANSGVRKWQRSSSNKVICPYFSLICFALSSPDWRSFLSSCLLKSLLHSCRRHWEEAQTWSQPTLRQRDEHSRQHSNRQGFWLCFYSPVINSLRVMQILVLISICRPFSSLRLYDICGWAAVCRVGPFLWHTSVPDHAGSHGAKQSQLGRLTAGAGSGLRGGRAQHGLRRHRRRCHRAEWRQHSYDRRRNQLQRNTSGKQRILTHSFCAISPQPRDPWGPQGLTIHWGGRVGHPAVCGHAAAPPVPNT